MCDVPACGVQQSFCSKKNTNTRISPPWGVDSSRLQRRWPRCSHVLWLNKNTELLCCRLDVCPPAELTPSLLLLIRLVRLPEQRCWLKCRLHLHPDKLDSCLHHVVVQDASSPYKRFIVNSLWPPWEQIKLPAAADPTVGQQKTFWFWFSPAALTVQDDRRVGETAQWVSDLSVPVYKWFTAMINHFRQKWKWK